MAPQYDYSKLLGKISERFGSQKDFAHAIGLTERTVSLKLNGKVQWRQGEIDKACEVLEIPKHEIPCYFFSQKEEERNAMRSARFPAEAKRIDDRNEAAKSAVVILTGLLHYHQRLAAVDDPNFMADAYEQALLTAIDALERQANP